MLVKRYEPFNDIRKGFDLVNAIINSVEEQRSETPKEQAIVDYIPNMNIRETAKSYHIEIELPGVSKENTDIQLDGDILTVSGERTVKEEQEEEYRKVESQYGKFSRAFTLPKQVDTGKIEASFELGILEISIPKKELVDTSKKLQFNRERGAEDEKTTFKTALLATLPFVTIHADNNISSDPFLNDPAFKHFQKMQEQMNRIMEEFNQDFFNDTMISPTFKSHFSNGFNSTPNTDLVDKGDYYELKMDLAGMEDKSIKIDVKDNYLSVQAKSETKKEKKEGDKIIHQERHVGMVQRGMTLPKDADAEKYKQEYKNGVLTITIPKKN